MEMYLENKFIVNECQLSNESMSKSKRTEVQVGQQLPNIRQRCRTSAVKTHVLKTVLFQD